MSQDWFVKLFVLITALAFVVQAFLLYGLFVVTRRAQEQIERIHSDLQQELQPVSKALQVLLGEVREPVRIIVANIAEITGKLRERTGQFDAVAADMLERTREQIVRLDQLMVALGEKVQQTADSVQQSVLVPVKEIAAVTKGLRAGLEFFFRRRPARRASETTQDEELFI